jgi:hypothetical protein
MPTDIWKIPLDSNGAVRGSYYLRHYTEISDTLGVVQFERGRSVEPLTGQKLVSFVAALGADVDLEPADDEARAAMGAKPHAKPENKPALLAEFDAQAEREARAKAETEAEDAFERENTAPVPFVPDHDKRMPLVAEPHPLKPSKPKR